MNQLFFFSFCIHFAEKAFVHFHECTFSMHKFSFFSIKTHRCTGFYKTTEKRILSTHSYTHTHLQGEIYTNVYVCVFYFFIF